MLEKMKEIIADQLSVDADSITEASSFKEDLGADSLDLFELVMALEDEYSVEIPSDDLQNLLTVGDELPEGERCRGVSPAPFFRQHIRLASGTQVLSTSLMESRKLEESDENENYRTLRH